MHDVNSNPNIEWLFFDGKPTNDVFDLTEEDIDSLIRLADTEDQWSKSVREQVKRNDKNHKIDPIIEMIGISNVGGTIMDYPFGKVLTIDSRRHLFRGEICQFKESLPSLNRAIKVRNLDKREAEIYRVVSNMRIWQFADFIQRFDIVRYWEYNLEVDVNFKALGQHYGFQTSLLDFTNDFRVALFMATCVYDWDSDSYRPLRQCDIDKSKDKYGDPAYGMIFHCPDWVLDYNNAGDESTSLNMRMMEDRDRQRPYPVDSPMLDGVVFQIGCQPFFRCKEQSGYIMPVRTDSPLQENLYLEKMRFRQSVELSGKVYEMMDGGRKVFPEEGISEAMPTIRQIQNSHTFSKDDMERAYEIDEADKDLFPTIDSLFDALRNFAIDGEQIIIQDEPVSYPLPRPTRRRINKKYNKTDVFKYIGGMMHATSEDWRRMRNNGTWIEDKPHGKSDNPHSKKRK